MKNIKFRVLNPTNAALDKNYLATTEFLKCKKSFHQKFNEELKKLIVANKSLQNIENCPTFKKDSEHYQSKNSIHCVPVQTESHYYEDLGSQDYASLPSKNDTSFNLHVAPKSMCTCENQTDPTQNESIAELKREISLLKDKLSKKQAKYRKFCINNLKCNIIYKTDFNLLRDNKDTKILEFAYKYKKQVAALENEDLDDQNFKKLLYECREIKKYLDEYVLNYTKEQVAKNEKEKRKERIYHELQNALKLIEYNRMIVTSLSIDNDDKKNSNALCILMEASKKLKVLEELLVDDKTEMLDTDLEVRVQDNIKEITSTMNNKVLDDIKTIEIKYLEYYIKSVKNIVALELKCNRKSESIVVDACLEAKVIPSQLVLIFKNFLKSTKMQLGSLQEFLHTIKVHQLPPNERREYFYKINDLLQDYLSSKRASSTYVERSLTYVIHALGSSTPICTNPEEEIDFTTAKLEENVTSKKDFEMLGEICSTLFSTENNSSWSKHIENLSNKFLQSIDPVYAAIQKDFRQKIDDLNNTLERNETECFKDYINFVKSRIIDLNTSIRGKIHLIQKLNIHMIVDNDALKSSDNVTVTHMESAYGLIAAANAWENELEQYLPELNKKIKNAQTEKKGLEEIKKFYDALLANAFQFRTVFDVIAEMSLKEAFTNLNETVEQQKIGIEDLQNCVDKITKVLDPFYEQAKNQANWISSLWFKMFPLKSEKSIVEKLEEIKSFTNSIQSRITELSIELSDKDSTIDSLRQQHSELKTVNQQLQNKIDEKEHQLNISSNLYQSATSEIQSKNRQLAKNTTDISNNTYKIKDLEEQLKNLNSTLLEYKNTFLQYAKQKKSLQRALSVQTDTLSNNLSKQLKHLSCEVSPYCTSYNIGEIRTTIRQNHVHASLQQLQDIESKVQIYEKQIKKLHTILETDVEYLHVREMLLRFRINIDNIASKEIPEVVNGRGRAIEYVVKVQNMLENAIVNNNP